VYTRPLFFDYNGTAAVATADFIKWHRDASGGMLAPQHVQFLKDGQHVRSTPAGARARAPEWQRLPARYTR
jgi:hypothetical protein